MAVATPSRPKAGGGRLYVVIGTVLALLSVVLFFVLGGVLTGSHSGSSQKVVVAAKPIALRQVITSDEVTLEDVSPAPKSAYTATKLVVGQAAELNILEGQVITTSMVTKSPDQIAGPAPAYLPIPAGFVAISIPTSEQQGVAGYPQPGDYITVVATIKVKSDSIATKGYSGDAAQDVTKTVFTNLRIIRVGPASYTSSGSNGSSQSNQTQGVASSLTVLMTECDAEYMNWFLQTAIVHYQLESYKDYTPAPTKPDSSCPTVTGTHGVNVVNVDNRFHFTQG